MSEFSKKELNFTFVFNNKDDEKIQELKDEILTYFKTKYNDFEIREKSDVILEYR